MNVGLMDIGSDNTSLDSSTTNIGLQFSSNNDLKD